MLNFLKNAKKTKKLKTKKLIVYFLWLCLVGLISLSIALIYLIRDLPSMAEISNRQVVESTKIYDRKEEVLLYEISSGQKRTVVPLDEIPQFLKEATIVVEDENFYIEPAFDWRAIIRASLANLKSGRVVQGGSTITQQLAKKAFLSDEQKITRKIKELVLAVQLNRNYSKDKILELYLNEIPYGPTVYGVEAASEAYFSKHAKDLNLAESALLAAIPRAPSYYSPWGNHTDELFSRQIFILKKLRLLNKIDDQQLEFALNYKISFSPQNTGIKAPHFVLAVQDYLVQKYGEDLVREGGLRVITTLDWDLQESAEKIVAEGASRNETLYKGKNAALLAQDAKTGQILAMVGSRDYFDTQNDGNFNVATQGLRQPGSALKPFIYLGAFLKGYSPQTVIFDVPTNFDTTGNPERAYQPENFDGIFRGPVSLKSALAQSINVPAVKVLYLIGLNNALKLANSLGLETLQDPSNYGLSLVLGGGAVKMIDLVEAYSILATEGVKHNQIMVLEVKDKNGNTIESFSDKPQKVIESQYAKILNSILSDPDARAPLFHNSLSLTVFPDRDVALKTGTSNDYRDAWALGYTPSLVVGVWAGNNNNSPMQKQGGSILAAVPIWSNFMSEAIKKYPSETFTRPEPIIPNKPFLAGNFATEPEYHSELYFINKNDPAGPPPQNPAQDPQFNSWESSFVSWAKENKHILDNYYNPDAMGGSSPIIQIINPSPGAYIQNSFSVSIKIFSRNELSSIKFTLNGQFLGEEANLPSGNSSITKNFTVNNLSLQNKLDIAAVDKFGTETNAYIIVYH
jgi:1A family penicillin-binding protein